MDIPVYVQPDEINAETLKERVPRDGSDETKAI